MDSVTDPAELIRTDLEAILDEVGNLLSELRNQRLFVTGGTGFFGHWLLDTLYFANNQLALNVDVTVLTRNPDAFRSQAAYLFESSHFHFIQGDIRDFTFPDGFFPYIIHAATTRAEETFRGQDALIKYDTVAEGTRHLLDFAVQSGSKKILWTSSGAVYGKQPENLITVPEDYNGGPDPLKPIAAALGIAKNTAEFFCACYADRHRVEIKIARCFSFLGPRMQMDIHYAVGNFIADAVRNEPITVKGDGTPLRSYMYITDLIIWLWTIFLKGEPLVPYNVGSDVPVSMADLAHLTADVHGRNLPVKILGSQSADSTVHRYIPNISKARETLKLNVNTDLKTGIRKVLDFETANLRNSGK